MKTIFKKIIVNILTWEAKMVLRKYKPKIVAVTGSVGKTTTKDAIHAVLSSTYFTRKSSKSFNSEIGVPLTILGCPNGWNNVFIWIKNILEGFALIILPNHYPAWLVLEVGADRPGDIKKLASWLNPNIAVITRLSKVPVHVEYFDSPEEVIKEKKYLALALHKDDVLVVNADDPDTLSFKNSHGGATITYGMSDKADMIGSNYTVIYDKMPEGDYPTGINFKIDYRGNMVPVYIYGSLGRQHIYSSLAACSVGLSQNINMVKIADALGKFRTPPGRMSLVAGIKNTTIIDDTYNSSPVAVEESLETLKNIKTIGKKICILGDMLELGKYSTDEHKRIGKIAGKISNILITVGIRSRAVVEGALESQISEKNIFQFDDSREAGKYVETILGKGDIVLIKGSQSMRMERAVEEIMANPENKEKLLVRQDEEWLKRV